jgi:hypothetical protein
MYCAATAVGDGGANNQLSLHFYKGQGESRYRQVARRLGFGDAGGARWCRMRGHLKQSSEEPVAYAKQKQHRDEPKSAKPQAIAGVAADLRSAAFREGLGTPKSVLRPHIS